MNIELKSEKVRNIVGKMPPKLLRFGTGIISIVVIMFSIMLYCIPYKQQDTFPVQIQYSPIDNYYVVVETSISKGKKIKVGMIVNILIERLSENYCLEGKIKRIIENRGRVSILITITTPECYIIHLNTSPKGIVSITTFNEPLLKRIIKIIFMRIGFKSLTSGGFVKLIN